MPEMAFIKNSTNATKARIIAAGLAKALNSFLMA